MDLEREIELLKEKVALLEKIKELQDAIKVKECTPIIPYIPYVPINPQPFTPWHPPWTPWYGPNTAGDPGPVTWTGAAYGGTPEHCRSIS